MTYPSSIRVLKTSIALGQSPKKSPVGQTHKLLLVCQHNCEQVLANDAAARPWRRIIAKIARQSSPKRQVSCLTKCQFGIPTGT